MSLIVEGAERNKEEENLSMVEVTMKMELELPFMGCWSTLK